MDDNVIPFPQRVAEPAPDRPPGPPPSEYPSGCYVWVAPSARSRGHWRKDHRKVAEYEARLVAKAAPAPSTLLPDIPVPPSSGNDAAWLDACVVAFFQATGRLPSRPEKVFLLRKGRWPLCEEETRQEETASAPDWWMLASGVVVVIGGALMAWVVG